MERLVVILLALLFMTGCALIDDVLDIVDSIEKQETTDDELIGENSGAVTPLDELVGTDIFQSGALEHILEGELNRKGNAVGYHYDRLPTKNGEIIEGTATNPNEYGVFEAKVIVSGVEKTSNQGKSTFFPNEWDTQDVVDAIGEAYDTREYVTGNTYEGLTEEGIVIQMYLNSDDKIISAFPIY